MITFNIFQYPLKICNNFFEIDLSLKLVVYLSKANSDELEMHCKTKVKPPELEVFMEVFLK